jgi:hypothetical protein
LPKFDVIEAEVSFRSPSRGGRKTLPRLNGTLRSSYRPHVVVGDDQGTDAADSIGASGQAYIGVAFIAGPDQCVFEQPAVARFALMYPGVDSSAVVPGAAFTVREGPHVVGQGRVIGRWVEELSPENA